MKGKVSFLRNWRSQSNPEWPTAGRVLSTGEENRNGRHKIMEVHPQTMSRSSRSMYTVSRIMSRCSMYTPVLQNEPPRRNVYTKGIFQLHRGCLALQRVRFNVSIQKTAHFFLMSSLQVNEVCSDAKFLTPLPGFALTTELPLKHANCHQRNVRYIQFPDPDFCSLTKHTC